MESTTLVLIIVASYMIANGSALSHEMTATIHSIMAATTVAHQDEGASYAASVSRFHGFSRRKKGAAPVQVVSASDTCQAPTSLPFCTVLVGASMSTAASGTTSINKAALLDSFIASAYENASSLSGWTWGFNSFKVKESSSCKMSFSSYFCLNPIVLSAHNLNGTCGMQGGASFTPCYSRCIHYQISCLGMSGQDAAKACAVLSSSFPALNTASDAYCFCGSNFLFGASENDVCSGNCHPNSECGTCPTIPRLDTCYPLVGASLSVTNGNLTTQGQAYALDGYITSSYTQATTPTGWTFGEEVIKISSPSPACRMAFSSYFCGNPTLLLRHGLSGACGITPPATFTPCLQRCVHFQLSCLGSASISAARANCTAPSPYRETWSTFDNGNCFCGNNFPYGGDSYDACAGPCNAMSECGSCPTVTSMSSCNVLVGTPLSSSSTTSHVQAQALEVDALVTRAYARAVTPAGWIFGAQLLRVNDSSACWSAFTSYLCLNPNILADHSLNGSCGIPPPAAFSPCLQRCVDFQTTCLGLPASLAPAACAASAVVGMNTASNANCYCSDSRPSSHTSLVCFANCSADNECSAAPRARPPPAAGLAAALIVMPLALLRALPPLS
jgi:hypothetical protein